MNCEVCGNANDGNYKIHSCFTIICSQCSSHCNECKKCNRSLDDCFEITLKNCAYSHICKSMAVVHCKCKNIFMCDHDYFKTHLGSVDCAKELVTTFQPDVCQKCNIFLVNYIGTMQLCNGCWMDTDDRHSYINVTEDAMKKIDECLLNDSITSHDINIKTIEQYNFGQFQAILNRIEHFQNRFFAKYKGDCDNMMARINQFSDRSSNSIALKYLKAAVGNKQIQLSTVLQKIKEWKKLNAVRFHLPKVTFKETNDANGFPKFEISVEMVNPDEIMMHTFMAPIALPPPIPSSPTSSVAMSLESGQSRANSPIHSPFRAAYVKHILPADEQNWHSTQITYLRDPFWIYVVNTELQQSRDVALGILANKPKLLNARNVHINEYYIVKDWFRKQISYKRAICLGKRASEKKNIYIQFIDYGNKCWVDDTDCFDYPESIKDVCCTIQLVKMAGIAPISNYCFLAKEAKAIREFIEKNMMPPQNAIKIKPILETDNEGIFCQFKSNIKGEEKDWGEHLIANGFGKRVGDPSNCFIANSDYCYSFHFDNKTNKICICAKDHHCPYCRVAHSLSTCKVLLDKLKNANCSSSDSESH
uniref:Tudor domain-containing protein n=1 Tax=Tetranychus urticae TaxID=32264 RepID=T1KWF3_TETUR